MTNVRGGVTNGARYSESPPVTPTLGAINLLTPVSAIMTAELVTVTVHTPLAEAEALFRRHGIHHLPVVDPAGALVGMLSHSDFLKLLGRDAATLTVRDLMTTGLAKLEPDDAVRTAAAVFALNKFHALPVVAGERLVGIVTTLDLIRMIDREEPALGDYGK